MKNLVLKLVLLLMASAGISFTFYLQGVKLQEMDEKLSNAKTDSIHAALGYKDSLIHFLQDSIHASRTPPPQRPVISPPIIISNSAVTSKATGGVLDSLYISLSHLVDTIGKRLLVRPFRQQEFPAPSSGTNGDSNLFIRLKQLYNDSLNKELGRLCADAIGIQLPRSRRDTTTVVARLGSQIDTIYSHIIRDERVLGEIATLLLPGASGPGKNTTYHILVNDMLKQELQTLRNYLQAKNARQQLDVAVTLLRSICAYNNNGYNYFR